MVPLRLPHLVAIGVSAALAVVLGLVAGFAGRATVVPEPPAHAHCPAPPPGQPVDNDGCALPPPAEESPTEVETPEPEPEITEITLRSLAESRGLKIGSAVHVAGLADEGYRTVLAREFNAVTAENVMKWRRVEPERGEYDRSAADELIAFARRHDQQVYGHTLVWHKQVPAWVTNGSFSDQELGDLLRRRVVDEASYFRGQVWAWDVVNEVLSDDGTLRESLWRRALGPDYVADAFRWARSADPDAKLFLNDFGIEGINAKSDGLYDLVQGWLADGVPIDGIGFQVHWTLDPLPSTFVENMERFTALGLDVAITELDVRIPEPVTEERLEQQADIYSGAMDACLAVTRCVSFTVWGFSDGRSWVPRAYPGRGAATMFDEDLRPKPAYAAVAAALRRSRTTRLRTRRRKRSRGRA